MSRGGFITLIFLGACASGAEEVEITAPQSEARTLIMEVLLDGRRTSAVAFDLRPGPPSPLRLEIDLEQNAQARAYFFSDPLERLGLAPGPVELTTMADALGLQLIPKMHYDARLIPGAMTIWEQQEPPEPIYIRPAQGLSAITVSIRAWATGELIGGVDVCLRDAPQNCASSMSGEARLTKVLKDTKHIVTLQQRGLVPTAVMVNSVAEDTIISGAIFMLSQDDADNFAQQAQVTPDLQNMGMVNFAAINSEFVNVQEIRPELQPSNGTYQNHFAGGLFLNVEPGDYQVAFEPSDPRYQFCGPSGAGMNWLGNQGNQVEIEVLPGYLTYIQSVVCI